MCGVFREGRHRSGERKAGFGGGVWNYRLDVCREHCCRWDWDRRDIALDRGGGSCCIVGAVCCTFGQGFWGRSQRCYGTVALFVLMGFFFLFFLASAVAAAGPLEMATRAAVEVFWEASLEAVSADMEGELSVGAVGVRGLHLLSRLLE